MNNGTLIHLIHQRRLRRRHRPNHTPIWVGAALALVGLIVLGAVVTTASLAFSAYAAYAYFIRDLPAPEEVGRVTLQSFQTTKIYDRTGQTLLYEIIDPQGGNRTYVPLGRIPRHLINATIASEDRTFYQNPGFDIFGITRAGINNLLGRPVQGGSSITQQLIKNVIIPPEERTERSVQRKLKEIVLAWELSRRYSGHAGKDQILEWYLNTVNYGNLAYGAAAAAEAYFGKPVEELTLAEAAMLAALPQAPAYNPLTAPEEAKRRQANVLDRMVADGYITEAEAATAKRETLHYASKKFDILAPHFVMYVRDWLEERFGTDLLYRGGLRVYTTLDLNMQQVAERIAPAHIARLKKDGLFVSNAALVSINPKTGEILAMLGSIDYFNRDIDGQVNVAIAPRQPGSAFKPFTYVTAFMQGYTPATMLMDVRQSFPDDPNPPYVPENYDRKYRGPVLVREALIRSLNIPAVKMLSLVGVKNVVATAHKMGINTLTAPYYGLSLTLGGGEVTPLDMAYAYSYSVFANNGVMAGELVPPEKQRPGFRELDPVPVLRVEDSTGRILYEYTYPKTRQVLAPPYAYLINDILADERLKLPILKLSRPSAAKTGSTNDFRDAWTIGYTPGLTTAVWVGNTHTNAPMGEVPGSRGAGPIWHDYMEEVLKAFPVEKFERPPGIVEVEVCKLSGLLPTEHCKETTREVFIRGTEPTQHDTLHQVFRICRPSGKLATVYCPPDQVEERVYQIYPSEAMDWVRENNIPQPPTEYDDTYGPTPAAGDAALLRPKAYSYVRGVVPIEGSAKGGDFLAYRLHFGEGLDPTAWTQIGPDHYNAVDHGTLEIWDTSALNGLYTLQLTVLTRDGQVRRDTQQVYVDNQPPRVKIIHPWPKKVYTLGEDEYINIQTETLDNAAMERVEFFVDEQMIGLSQVAPFSLRWNLTKDSVGEHKIYVVAYDAAGNEAKSAEVQIRVKQ